MEESGRSAKPLRKLSGFESHSHLTVKIIERYKESFIIYNKEYPLLRKENVCQEQKIFKPKTQIQTGFFFLKEELRMEQRLFISYHSSLIFGSTPKLESRGRLI